MSRISLIIWCLLAVAAILIVPHAIRRDIRYGNEYLADLRNRVVGARLVEDGRDPYFHKWKSTEGIRYYDPESFSDWRISATTVTPFFLHLMLPLADLQQVDIVPLWLGLEYLAFAGILVIALCLARTPGRKQAVLLFALLFLLTNAWKDHTSQGQSYIFQPLLAALFYLGMRRKDSLAGALLAGLFAVSFILLRPIGIFFFLPFVFLIRRYPRNWLIAFCIPPLLLGGWSLISPRERGLWQQYALMLREHTLRHQHLPGVHVKIEPDPHYPVWEGIDKTHQLQLWDQEQDKYYSEVGNVFVIYAHLFGRTLPVRWLPVLLSGVVIVLLFVFYRRHAPFRELTLEQVTLFGSCLYMIADVFAPVYRNQYNTTQWLFPLLLAVAILKPEKRIVMGCLLAAMLLNIVHIPHVKMENSIGEYSFLVILLALSLAPGVLEASKPVGASVSPDQ